MRRPDTKLIVSAVAAFSILVLVASGFASKRPILEQWYIWQLELDDEQKRDGAVRKLAEMGAVGALPRLFEIFGRLSDVEVHSARFWSTGLSPCEMLSFYLSQLISVSGKRGVPYLVTAFDDESWYVARSAGSLLGSIGSHAPGAIPALTTARRHESELVRHAAADALKKIQGETPSHDRSR